MHAVIDGKQRLETALAWHRGELAIPAEWLDPQFIPDSHASAWVTRDDLTVPGQRLTDHRMIVQVAEAKVATVKDEAAIYLLVNGGGTAQTGDDLARAAAVAAGDGRPSPHFDPTVQAHNRAVAGRARR